MEFSRPKPRRLSEPALPMINVVFLLLIFFLMSAQIAAPPPIDVTPPVANPGEVAPGEVRLHIAADGTLALQEARGEAALGLLAQVEDPARTGLLIRADARLPAAELARVLARVAAFGFERVQLATVAR